MSSLKNMKSYLNQALTACLLILTIFWGYGVSESSSKPSGDGSSETKEFTFETNLVPGPVNYTVILPKDYETSKKSYPFFLYLHGHNYYKQNVDLIEPIIRKLWEEGSIPQMVIAIPNCYSSWYVDYKDGSQK